MKTNIHQTLLLSVTLIAGILLAVQTNQSANLEQRVATLERKVAALETKVSTPAASSAAAQKPAATTANNEGWRDVANWRKLQTGMSMDQVRRLLGEPKEVSVTLGYTTWRYTTTYPYKTVDFDTNRRVSGWRE